MSELVVRDGEAVHLVHPTTAEMLDLGTATREQIADWYLSILAWQANAQQAIRIAEQVFAELSDKETSLGVSLDGYRVSVPGAQQRFVPDEEALRKALLQLAEEGAITRAAADEACAPKGLECPHCGGFVATGGYKLSAKALNALRKVARTATIIDGCGEYVDPSRSFSVKRT